MVRLVRVRRGRGAPPDTEPRRRAGGGRGSTSRRAPSGTSPSPPTATPTRSSRTTSSSTSGTWATTPPPARRPPAALGGKATIEVAPSTFGPNVLYVRSVDRAGNRGPLEKYFFTVDRACADVLADTCAAAVYGLDQTSGTTAPDTSGHDRTLTVKGADWVAGHNSASDPTDKALRFNGTTDHATAVSAVHTGQAFTVSAWVRPTSLDQEHLGDQPGRQPGQRPQPLLLHRPQTLDLRPAHQRHGGLRPRTRHGGERAPRDREHPGSTWPVRTTRSPGSSRSSSTARSRAAPPSPMSGTPARVSTSAAPSTAPTGPTPSPVTSTTYDSSPA